MLRRRVVTEGDEQVGDCPLGRVEVDGWGVNHAQLGRGGSGGVINRGLGVIPGEGAHLSPCLVLVSASNRH